MKTAICICLLAIGYVIASDVIQYDSGSIPVPNRVTRFIPSADTMEYAGKTGFLVITNMAVQRGNGVTTSNLVSSCVVDGQQVRLVTQSEVDAYNAWQTLQSSNALWQTKYEARVFATNVISGADGMELFLRSMAEANWYFLNQIRTNLSRPALTKQAYLDQVMIAVDQFGK